jgi:hypothetical protein
MTDSASAFPCPCCGYLVFAEPPGSYSICPVCFWEDDAQQLEFATTLAGGANSTTLAQAQESFRRFGAWHEKARRHVRAPGDTPRDPGWRPIDPDRDHFPECSAEPRAPDDPEALYYWRPSFWMRRGAPDRT